MPKGNSQGNPSDSFPFRFALTKESEDLIFERSRITCVAQSDRYNSGKAERGGRGNQAERKLRRASSSLQELGMKVAIFICSQHQSRWLLRFKQRGRNPSGQTKAIGFLVC